MPPWDGLSVRCDAFRGGGPDGERRGALVLAVGFSTGLASRLLPSSVLSTPLVVPLRILLGREPAPEFFSLHHVEEGSGRRAASHADKNEEEEEADELCDSEALFDDELFGKPVDLGSEREAVTIDLRVVLLEIDEHLAKELVVFVPRSLDLPQSFVDPHERISQHHPLRLDVLHREGLRLLEARQALHDGAVYRIPRLRLLNRGDHGRRRGVASVVTGDVPRRGCGWGFDWT